MIRHKLLTAVVAAAVLTLGACGSTSGSATVESPASSSASSAAESTTEAAADTTEDAATTTAGEDESGDSGATVTVEGDMDAQSAAWFGTVCEGVSPMLDAVFGAMGAMMGSTTGGTSDDASAAKQAQATLVETFNKAADAMTAAGAKLSSLPPPTVEHGEEIAAEAAAGLAKAGPALKQVADGLSKATVNSMEDLSTVMQQASDAVNQDLDSLSLNNFELSDQMQAEVAKIPSCAPLMSLGAMGGDSSAAAPTS